MATKTWNPTSGNLASTDANWTEGTKPTTGDDVVFSSGSTACTWDITETVNSFTINGYTGTITQSSDMSIGAGGYSQASGTFTGITTKTVTCAGDFTIAAGTLSADSLILIMSGDGKTLSLSTNSFLRKLTISGSVTATSTHAGNTIITYALQVDSGKSISIATGKTLFLAYYSQAYVSYSNAGTIAGAGTLRVMLYDADKTITFGVVNCPVLVNGYVSSTANRVLSLAANADLGSTLNVISEHASNTMTLSHGTNYTLTVAGLTTLGTRGVMTQGTGAWAFTGGFTQSGASSVFTQGGDVTIGATGFSMSDGTFTPTDSKNLTCAGPFIRSAGLITDARLNLIWTATSSDFTWQTGYALNTLTLSSGAMNFLGTFQAIVNKGVTLAAGTTINLGTGTILDLRLTTGSLSNSGTINGPGTMKFVLKDADMTVTAGAINAPVSLDLHAAAGANRSFILGANASFGGALTVQSLHASNTITLSHGSNYQLTVAGAVTLGTRAIMTQGTGTWTFGSFTQNGASSVFTQGGNVVVSGDTSITAGTMTGSTSYIWTNAGSYTASGATLTNYQIVLKMTGADKTITATGYRFYKIIVDANTAIANSLYTNHGFVVSSGITLTISAGTVNLYAPFGDFSNLGTILGAGIIKFSVYSGVVVGNLVTGVINCPVQLGADSDISGNRVITATSNWPLGSTLSVSSGHASNTLTLDLAGYNLQANGITVGTRGILLGGEGVITNAGNFDSSAGVFTPETSQLVMTGLGKTLKLAAGGTVYDLLSGPHRLTLASDVTVSNIFAHVQDLSLGGFALTMTRPSEDYMGRKRVLKQNVKKRLVGCPLCGDLFEGILRG